MKEETKKTKKFNKKYLAFGILGLFALALVSAGLIVYYGQSTHEINVELPIEYTGDAEYSINGFSGEVLEGNQLTMENKADFEVLMQISDNTPNGIKTTYKGNLELTKKTVDFTKDVWDVLGGKVQIEYTVVGEEFNAEVVGDGIEGYELIYYKDNSDRFSEPAEAILVEGNSFTYLPYKTDRNSEEDGTYDYCVTNEYVTCHGAKIWYVPSDAILVDGLDWSIADEFYFESSLIQYNAEGQIIVYPTEELDFTPEFDVSLGFTGTADITTSVAPVM